MLAQTLPFAHDPWPSIQFWVQVIIAILMPIVIVQMEAYRRRLRDGDQKFSTLETTQAAVAEVLKQLTEQNRTINSKLDLLVQKDNDVTVESIATVGQLRAEIEREFVRKIELERLENRLMGSLREVVEEVRKLRK